MVVGFTVEECRQFLNELHVHIHCYQMLELHRCYSRVILEVVNLINPDRLVNYVKKNEKNLNFT